MRVGLLSGQVFSPFGGQSQRSRSPGTKTRLALRSPTIQMVCLHCKRLLLQYRRTSAFRGRRAVTSAVACTEAWNWERRRRLRPNGAICVQQACWRTCWVLINHHGTVLLYYMILTRYDLLLLVSEARSQSWWRSQLSDGQWHVISVHVGFWFCVSKHIWKNINLRQTDIVILYNKQTEINRLLKICNQHGTIYHYHIKFSGPFPHIFVVKLKIFCCHMWYASSNHNKSKQCKISSNWVKYGTTIGKSNLPLYSTYSMYACCIVDEQWMKCLAPNWTDRHWNGTTKSWDSSNVECTHNEWWKKTTTGHLRRCNLVCNFTKCEVICKIL